jgi:hypothetical protein
MDETIHRPRNSRDPQDNTQKVECMGIRIHRFVQKADAPVHVAIVAKAIAPFSTFHEGKDELQVTFITSFIENDITTTFRTSIFTRGDSGEDSGGEFEYLLS